MNKNKRKELCALFLSALFVVEAQASVIKAVSCSKTDVQSSLDSASAGDTIMVPAGNCSWTSMTVNKVITLQGSGPDQTNITLSGDPSLTITKQPSGIIKLQGFTFTASGGGSMNQPIVIDGAWSAQPIIIQNNVFNQKDNGLFHVKVPGGMIFTHNISNGGWDDGAFAIKSEDSSSWSKADSMGNNDKNGTLNNYIEDNTFYGHSNGIIDMDDNSRVVIRHNIFSYGGVNSHGMDTSPHGLRHFEIYENNFQHPEYSSQLANVNWLIWIRGGTGVIFNNSIDQISGGTWGKKPEGKFDIRAEEDGSGASYGTYKDGRAWLSSGKGNYPRQRQLGINWSPLVNTNGGYFIDPIYIWGNTGSGANNSGGLLGFENGGAWGSQTGYFVSGRDYYNDGTVKSGYTPYSYPHPLTLSGTSQLVPPTNLKVTP